MIAPCFERPVTAGRAFSMHHDVCSLKGNVGDKNVDKIETYQRVSNNRFQKLVERATAKPYKMDLT